MKKKEAIYADKYFDPKNISPGFYRVRRDTIVRVIDNKIFTGIVTVEDVPVDIEEGIIKIKLPKIPAEIITKIHDFFKYVYNKYRSESVILLWYNFNTNTWSIEVPDQVVTGASVEYERDIKDDEELRAKGFTFVGSIHSHGEMSAFHSGTDDADEYNFDGIHITIGKVISGPEFACRFIMKDISLPREPEEVMDIPEYVVNVPEPWITKVKKPVYNIRNNIGRTGNLLYNDNSIYDDLDSLETYKKGKKQIDWRDDEYWKK